jgi:hypothetical protein
MCFGASACHHSFVCDTLIFGHGVIIGELAFIQRITREYPLLIARADNTGECIES